MDHGSFSSTFPRIYWSPNIVVYSFMLCSCVILTAGTGPFIQWINSDYMENKFKISSNTNSLIIFWIHLKFILQFVSTLFSAYIQNIVVKYTVNILKSKCGGNLSTATHYLQKIDLGSDAGCFRTHRDRPPESPLGGWFPKSGIFWFSVHPISSKTCPNCTWPLPIFWKIVQTLGTGLLEVQNLSGLQDSAFWKLKISIQVIYMTLQARVSYWRTMQQ